MLWTTIIRIAIESFLLRTYHRKNAEIIKRVGATAD